jgi:hypothetical protein
VHDKARRLVSNPRFWQVFHGVNVVKWLVLFPPGMIWWRTNIAFLMFVSLDTALTGALAGYGTALAARKADPEDPL